MFTHVKRTCTAAALVLAGLAILAGCGETARLPFESTLGPSPTLPEPNRTLIPTVHIAPAEGWPDGIKPNGPPGTTVTAFAAKLDHPRWLYVLPNGDVL